MVMNDWCAEVGRSTFVLKILRRERKWLMGAAIVKVILETPLLTLEKTSQLPLILAATRIS